MIDCLVNELKKLKESSKEAVENTDSFNKYKRYMHVERKVEKELITIIDLSKETIKKQLILVCGSVGDGKSHLISHLKNNKGILENIKIYNDATESSKPKQDYIQNLKEVLNEFADANLYNGDTKKIIIAINLGTLSNFLDLQEIEDEFSKLKNYVEGKRIFDKNIIDNSFDEDSYFQFVNFSDYNLYSLNKEGVKSEFIEKLLEKIVQNNGNNKFYNSYKNNCTSCNYNNCCSVKNNFELLMEKDIRAEIIQVLIEAIVKNKIIISTRTLLNFFYDIMVHYKFSFGNENNVKYYLDGLLPNLLFSHGDLSNLLNTMQMIDPVDIKTEKIDQLIVKLYTLDNKEKLFNNNLKDFEIINVISTIILSITPKEDVSKITQLLIRLYRLAGDNDDYTTKDVIYENYINDMYNFNNGNLMELRNTNDLVKYAIYKWNGESEDEHINISLGKKQFRYQISQKINIKADYDELKEIDKDVLDKFIPEIILKFKANEKKIKDSISIDYNLYKLFYNIKKGYKPNFKDKKSFINFDRYVDKLSEQGFKNREITIIQKQEGSERKFTLFFNDEYGHFEFKEKK